MGETRPGHFISFLSFCFFVRPRRKSTAPAAATRTKSFSKGFFDWHKTVVAWFKTADEIVLRCWCRIRGRQPDCYFNFEPRISVVLPFRVVVPVPKVAFDRLGKISGVALTDVKRLFGVFIADHIGPGHISQRV